MMIFVIAAMATLALQGGGWTWTLYENEGPLVLANEITDTPRLRATLQCEPGSGVAQVAVYGAGLEAGFAQVSSGEANATAEAALGRDDKLSLALRTDHPVFSRFAMDGNLTVATGTKNRVVQVEGPHLAKLRRFAELCGG